MKNDSPDENAVQKPTDAFDAIAALTIKVFVSMIFTVGAVVAVMVTLGFVFGVWSTMDQDLATNAANMN